MMFWLVGLSDQQESVRTTARQNLAEMARTSKEVWPWMKQTFETARLQSNEKNHFILLELAIVDASVDDPRYVSLTTLMPNGFMGVALCRGGLDV